MQVWSQFTNKPDKTEEEKLIVQLIGSLSTHHAHRGKPPEQIYMENLQSANIPLENNRGKENPGRAVNKQDPRTLPHVEGMPDVKTQDYHADVPVSGAAQEIESPGSVRGKMGERTEGSHEGTHKGDQPGFDKRTPTHDKPEKYTKVDDLKTDSTKQNMHDNTISDDLDNNERVERVKEDKGQKHTGEVSKKDNSEKSDKKK